MPMLIQQNIPRQSLLPWSILISLCGEQLPWVHSKSWAGHAFPDVSRITTMSGCVHFNHIRHPRPPRRRCPDLKMSKVFYGSYKYQRIPSAILILLEVHANVRIYNAPHVGVFVYFTQKMSYNTISMYVSFRFRV